MPVNFNRTLPQLRSSRDLRAEMLSLAASLAGNSGEGRLILVDPVISGETVRAEWDRLMPAFAPAVQQRMKLEIKDSDVRSKAHSYPIDTGTSLLDRPNYRYEVLRLLLAANLEGDGLQSVKGMVEKIGASQTPIRQALADLKQAGLCRRWSTKYEVAAEDVSMDLLARTGALPQTLRFRFEQGARIKSPAELLDRALPLLGPKGPSEWNKFALSGTPVALATVPEIDLMGTPRLDLVAHVPREDKSFDTRVLRILDDGLEREPSVVAPAPVVVTLVRAKASLVQHGVVGQARCAQRMDVFLSLLDVGLREQALQYAKGIRP